MANFLLFLIWVVIGGGAVALVWSAPDLLDRVYKKYVDYKVERERLKQERLHTEILEEERLNAQLYEQSDHHTVGRTNILRPDFKAPREKE
jgi:hypothetical protein